MSTPIYPRQALTRMLDAIQAAELNGGAVKLFQNDFQPTDLSVIADFVEADFGGYAAITHVEFTDPAAINDLNAAQVNSDNTLDFVCDGTAPTNIIYGYWYINSTNDLVVSERFDVPQSMSLLGDSIMLVLRQTEPLGLGVAILEP